MSIHEEKIVRELHNIAKQIDNLTDAVMSDPGLPQDERFDARWILYKLRYSATDSIYQLETDIFRRTYEVHDDH